jgi:hypothetical protein
MAKPKKESAGQRILAGLKDAIAGKFAAVTIDGERWVQAPLVDELIEMVRLLEKSLVYEIKKSRSEGDAEGANLKGFTLVQVRDLLKRVNA